MFKQAKGLSQGCTANKSFRSQNLSSKMSGQKSVPLSPPTIDSMDGFADFPSQGERLLSQGFRRLSRMETISENLIFAIKFKERIISCCFVLVLFCLVLVCPCLIKKLPLKCLRSVSRQCDCSRVPRLSRG